VHIKFNVMWDPLELTPLLILLSSSSSFIFLP